MATKVAGELYKSITGQLFEIGRQLRQSNGYPFDPENLKNHLQAAVEGRFVSAEAGVVRITVDLNCDKAKDSWEYFSDVKEPTGELTLELVEFLEKEEACISGKELVKRAKKRDVLLGQRHVEALLRNQSVIPEEWREYYLVFPGSVLQDPDGRRHVPDLYWGGGRWFLRFHRLEHGFSFLARLVGSRK